ncbi:MAG: VWA domain-containing protein [Candidatus Desulforudis sp.]|nr:VWA domain-containing protein [Desulforudis sp.]
MAVVLVIDASGSMVWNDPDRVRVEAAQKTLDLLKEDDYLALVEFASGPRLIMPLRPVGGEDGRREIFDLIDQVGQQGDSHILGGLQTAFQQLREAPADARKFVILLSDGESDVPGVTDTPWGRQEYFGETEGLLARYVQQAWPVHCIGFYEQEAGPELKNIARKTAGEYQFVAEAEDLKNIFANILLAAKYPPGVQPVFGAALVKQEGYLVGDTLTARAHITIGDDRVLPGPYLELTGMNLVVTRPDTEATVVPFVESAEDGVFKAETTLDTAAEYEVMATSSARYRGHDISESIVLGSVVTREEVRAPLVSIDPAYIKGAIEAAAFLGAVTAYLLLAVFTLLLWRLRLRERVGGELRVWAQTNVGHKYAKHRLRLGKARKREVKIATGKDEDCDFRLEALERDFSFLIRSSRDPLLDPKLSCLQRLFRGPKMLYQVICLPGTVMQMGDKLKTRELLYDGDSFEIGGYVFGFQYAYVGKRPGGENVLDSYKSMIGEPKEPKGKGKKILTLRVRDK